MAWIKFEKDLLSDPRVLRIARALESRWQLQDKVTGGLENCNAQALPGVTLVCGALVRIWSLADTHIDPDDVFPLGIEELDDLIGIPEFCSLMPADWMLPIDAHSVKLPGFHEHNGTEAKKKAVTQRRVARHRSSVTPRNAQALPDQTRPDKTRNIEPDQKAKGKHALPAGWTPNASTVAWCGREFGLRVPEDVDRYVAAFSDIATARSYRYADWDSAFRNCIRQDWPKLRGTVIPLPATERKFAGPG